TIGTITELPNSAFAQIGYRNREPFDLVVHAANIARLGSNEDAGAGERLARFAKFVLADGDGFRLAVDIEGNAFFAATIDDAVSLKAIPMRRKGFVPSAKMDAGLATAPDVIIPNEVVR